MARSLTLSHTDPVLARTGALLERLFPPPRGFAVRLWDGTELPAARPPSFRLVLAHPGALRRMLAPPLERSMGEAWIHGDFDIEGDLHAAFAALATLLEHPFSLARASGTLLRLLALPASGRARAAGRGPAHLAGRRHSLRRDRAAVQYHYDVGNDFYALWLDRGMQYSCAYFPAGDEDLDTAQRLKLDLIARKLRLRPGQNLLDIGCGWGGLVTHAAARHGVRATGVTLSAEQARYAGARIAAAGLGDRARVLLTDYRDLARDPASPGGAPFDALVSVGMFEHVGRRRLPEYFARAWRLLRPGGLFLNHGIACPPDAPAARDPLALARRLLGNALAGTSSFVQRYVFPDSELIPVSEVNLAAERAGFEVRDVENLREHYALTLRHWARRLRERRDEAVRLTDDVTWRTWIAHLVSSAHGFETGRFAVHQTLLVRPGPGGAAGLPLSRADIYAGPA